MGLISGLKSIGGDIAGIGRDIGDQVKPFLPRNPIEALLLPQVGGLALSQYHKSKDIGAKADENEKFQKISARRGAIERAMGGNRLGRTLEPPKPLDLSNYAGSDALKSILSQLVGSQLGKMA